MEKENKKGRGVINLFDIVLLLAALALGVLLYIGSRDEPVTVETKHETVPILYTVEFQRTEESFPGYIHVGDPVVDRIKKYNVGVVESVEYEPYTRLVPDYESSTMVLSEEPGRVTVRVTIRTEARITERDVIIDGGYVTRVGESVNLKFPETIGLGTTVVMEKVEA